MDLYRQIHFPLLLHLFMCFFTFYNEYLIWSPPDKEQKKQA